VGMSACQLQKDEVIAANSASAVDGSGGVRPARAATSRPVARVIADRSWSRLSSSPASSIGEGQRGERANVADRDELDALVGWDRPDVCGRTVDAVGGVGVVFHEHHRAQHGGRNAECSNALLDLLFDSQCGIREARSALPTEAWTR
jgi:hypothetical protein